MRVSYCCRWVGVASRKFGDTDRAILGKALRRDAQNGPLLSQGRTPNIYCFSYTIVALYACP